MKIGTTHAVEIFRDRAGTVHATPAVKGWQFRSSICGVENPVTGWKDIPETGPDRPKAGEVHRGRCANAIKVALREKKAAENRALAAAGE